MEASDWVLVTGNFETGTIDVYSLTVARREDAMVLDDEDLSWVVNDISWEEE